MNGIGKISTGIIKGIFGTIIALYVLYAIINQVPNTPATKSFKEPYEFLVRLLIDWSSPDPTLWLIRIVILFAVGLGGWKYINSQPRE